MDFIQRVRMTPTFPKASMHVRAALAVAAIVIGTTCSGGLLGLHEMPGSGLTVALIDAARFVETSDDTMRIAEMQAAAEQ